MACRRRRRRCTRRGSCGCRPRPEGTLRWSRSSRCRSPWPEYLRSGLKESEFKFKWIALICKLFKQVDSLFLNCLRVEYLKFQIWGRDTFKGCQISKTGVPNFDMNFSDFLVKQAFNRQFLHLLQKLLIILKVFK